MPERTTKQKKASQRNWAKARLIGMTQYSRQDFTEDEWKVMEKIRVLQLQLLDNWNVNTQELSKKL